GALAISAAAGFATRHFVFLRHYFPDQQVAALLPHQARFLSVASPWWQSIDGVVRCGMLPGSCSFTRLNPIKPGFAAAVLGAWLIAAALAAYLVLRARDVPQLSGVA